MDMATRVQIPDKAVCVSHNANTLGKGMSPTLFSQAMLKMIRQIGLFNLGRATSLGEGKLWIQTC